MIEREKMKVYVAKFESGRILVLGDTGQTDKQNKEEIQEVIDNLKININEHLVKLEHVYIDQLSPL